MFGEHVERQEVVNRQYLQCRLAGTTCSIVASPLSLHQCMREVPNQQCHPVCGMQAIIAVLNKLSKVALPKEITQFIHDSTANYGKVQSGVVFDYLFKGNALLPWNTQHE